MVLSRPLDSILLVQNQNLILTYFYFWKSAMSSLLLTSKDICETDDETTIFHPITRKRVFLKLHDKGYQLVYNNTLLLTTTKKDKDYQLIFCEKGIDQHSWLLIHNHTGQAHLLQPSK